MRVPSPYPDGLTRRHVLAGVGGLTVGTMASGLLAARPAHAAALQYGVDYSWDRPSPSSLLAAGYTFACRYLSWDQSKNLSPEEAKQLTSVGISVVSNWEYDVNEALSGYAKGVESATEAARQAAWCGQPSDRPIYFSVDFDATEANQTQINAYFDGVASVIGRNRCGAYGGYYVIQRLFDAGKITWGWQTYAWSGGQWDSRVHLRQVQNGITVGGADCDRDEAWKSDFGQWGTSTSNLSTSVSTDGVLVTTDNRVAIYRVRSDGNVWGINQGTPGGAFGSWQQLTTSGGYTGKVAALRDAANRIALYVRCNGTIYGASQSTAGGAFGVWRAIGTNGAGVTSDPTAVYGANGVIAIYATTGNGNVSGVNQTQAGGSFGSWQQLTTGGGYTGKPAAVVDGQRRIALYVRCNGTIYGASQSTAGGAFSAWRAIGSNGAGITSDPHAVYGVGGIIALYATTSNGNVSGVNQTQAGGSWGSWQQLTSGGGYIGKPTVITDSMARVAIYVRRSGTIYGASQSTPGGDFGTWRAIGTNGAGIAGDPTVVRAIHDILAIYANTSTDNVSGVNQDYANGPWGGWVQID